MFPFVCNVFFYKIDVNYKEKWSNLSIEILPKKGQKLSLKYFLKKVQNLFKILEYRHEGHEIAQNICFDDNHNT